MRYATKKYDNPFFREKRPSFDLSNIDYDISFRIKFYAGTFIVLMLITAAFMLYSDHFQIKNIDVRGGGMIDPGKISNIAWEQANSNLIVFFPQKNIFLYSKDKLLARLNEKYSFESININKDLPARISIEYIEKKYAVIWQENEKYYYTSMSGEIIAETNVLDIEQKDYPLINNVSDKKIADNKITVDAVYLNYASDIWEKFKPLTDLKIERIIIDNEIDTIKVKLEGGPEVYFDPTGDMDKQISKMTIIKNEKLKEDFNKKIYVDVRLGDAVYYR